MSDKVSRKLARRSELAAVESISGISRTTLAYIAEGMLCHFAMKKGAVIPLHDHAAAQIGYIVSGAVRFLRADGSSFVAQPGTGYAFDGNERHGAEVLEDSEVIECFSPARLEYADN